MTLWLIYEQNNVARNAFFIHQWQRAAQEKKVKLFMVHHDALRYGIRQGFPWLIHAEGLPLPDHAVIRANLPLLSRTLERLRVCVHNNAYCARVFNDKRETHLAFSDIAPMMDTAFLTGEESKAPFPYPVVIKSAHGCGGREVYLARTDEEFLKAVQSIAPDQALAQPLCDEPGKDLRVYTLGKEIYQTMLRSSDSDFRSNIGKGGLGQPWPLEETEKRIVLQVLDRFSPDFIGVDFIRHQGQWVFNEVEDAVGTRMLYALGNRNPAQDYLDHILRNPTPGRLLDDTIC